MINEPILTLDIDWANDIIIENVANKLLKNNVKATWFVTHKSPAINMLANYPKLFELGLHPNFRKNTTQGKTALDVMENLKVILPNSKSIRTHSIIQSSPLLMMFARKFNMLYDCSLFIPETANLSPHKLFLPDNLSIIRFPYFWEDDMEMYRPKPSFSLKDKRYNAKGLKIFDFHPIHIFLNSNNMRDYYRVKKHNKKTVGVGNFFMEVIKFIKDNSDGNGCTISELADKCFSN